MIKIENLSVVYHEKVKAVRDLSLNVECGEMIGIIGQSGSGKSSLIKAINLLVKPQSGSICIDEIDLVKLKNKALRKKRREMGFIFQDYNLVDQLSVLENVLMGRLGYKSSLQSVLGVFNDEDFNIALDALSQVGLDDKVYARGDQLSGGQKQRVAIAKALAQKPKIILADEPVASLDRQSALTVMNYFKKINEKSKITILINLHDVELSKQYCHRLIGLKEGQLIFNCKVGEVNDQQLHDLYVSSS